MLNSRKHAYIVNWALYLFGGNLKSERRVVGFVQLLVVITIHAVMSVAVITKIQLNGSTRPNGFFEVHPAFRVV